MLSGAIRETRTRSANKHRPKLRIRSMELCVTSYPFDTNNVSRSLKGNGPADFGNGPTVFNGSNRHRVLGVVLFQNGVPRRAPRIEP
jgi:hypothetical protein